MNTLITTIAIALLASPLAFATPEYTNNTYANFPYAVDASSTTAQITSDLNQGPGYYIWNSAPTDWHIRWASLSGTDIFNFQGAISVAGAGFSDVATFKWDGLDAPIFEFSQSTFGGLATYFGFTIYDAATNCCWDGLDMTLNAPLAEGVELAFTLASDLWNLSDFNGASFGGGAQGGLSGEKIYIGDTFETPDVELVSFNGLVGQRFEISVPEPGSLALFSLGLIGLGFARHKLTTS